MKNPGAGQVLTKYYLAGATRIALKKYTIPQPMTVEYLLGDHLGSTSLTTDTSGAKVSEIRYKPWGEIRYSWTSGVSTTPAYKLPSYTFTGQYSYMDDPTTTGITEGFGLMFYGARWYDPYITQFSQPDSIVSDPYNPQAWNRYSYVFNNPLRYTDPSGHRACEAEDKHGNCIDLKTSIKIDLESKYDIKIKGGWDENELISLQDALSKLAAYAGGADNLNDVFHDALKANNINTDRIIFDNVKQENCPGDAQACWQYDKGTISLSDAVFSAQYQTRPGAFRPAELGLKGNIEASIQVTIVHEIVHAFADARPAAAKIYSWRVPIPGTDPEERMANTIAFYVVSGMQNWPGKPNHFDFVRDITALWQATP